MEKDDENRCKKYFFALGSSQQDREEHGPRGKAGESCDSSESCRINDMRTFDI